MNNLATEIEAVQQIPMVPAMLEVICRTTGMGFAAIARVTGDRWIACSVRDEIQFGLQAGGELKIETTICNEIRDSLKPVIIDHVGADETYVHHHTPKMYGFQSYISFPIVLKNGAFFGTLCAIDPRPAQLNNPKIIGTFSLFVELIAFHLQSFEMVEQSHFALQEANRQLTFAENENRQYRFISNHNLREPLRKIGIFSDFLVKAAEGADLDKARHIASRISSFSQELTTMIRDLTDFSELTEGDPSFEKVDLNKTLFDVCSQLDAKLHDRNASVNSEPLHTVLGIPIQMAQLFFHLVNNALSFSKSDIPPLIRVYSRDIAPHQASLPLPAGNKFRYCEICIEDNGIGIEAAELEKIFDIFVRLNPRQTSGGFGAGLAHCRKIVHNHGGIITARSTPGQGTAFSIVLPVERT